MSCACTTQKTANDSNEIFENYFHFITELPFTILCQGILYAMIISILQNHLV